jgi:hypothetical protein
VGDLLPLKATTHLYHTSLAVIAMSSITAIFAAAPLDCRRLPLPLTAVINCSRRLLPSPLPPPPSSVVAVAARVTACRHRRLPPPPSIAFVNRPAFVILPPSPSPPPLPAIKMASRADRHLLEQWNRQRDDEDHDH